MRKLFLVAASVVYGDYCYNSNGVSVRVALKSDRIQVDASAPAAWVGIGFPKSPDYKEMARGQFVMGAASQIFQYTLDMDYNWKPNKELTSLVDGSGRVSTANGYTNMSFARLLVSDGLYSVDTKKPFNLLWASGPLKAGQQGYAALDYHQRSRGHVSVDLVNNNCVALPTSNLPVGKSGKKNRKGKVGQGAVCAVGQIVCTALLRQQGQNCVIGTCVAIRRQSESDASSCASILCQDNTQCVNGECVPLDNSVMCTMDAKTCPDGSSVGRVPPSCAFATCSGKQGKVAKGAKAAKGGKRKGGGPNS